MAENVVHFIPSSISGTFGGLVASFSANLDYYFQLLSVVGQSPQCFTMFVQWQTSKIILLTSSLR